MSFAKTLFAGAAVCALCTAPALAARSPAHLVSAGLNSPSKLLHVKTNAGSPNVTDVTLTYSFSAYLSRASFHEVPVQFIQYTWQNTLTCIPPVREGMTIVPKRNDGVARIKVGSTTGPTSACPSSTFTFYGPLYELEAKNATSDSFVAKLHARRYSGYTYTLVENWAVTIAP